MLPLQVAVLLGGRGHDAVTPTQLGAHNLPDEVLVQLATAGGRVIVTENASDFAHVSTCPVLFVLKSWWPSASLASRLAVSIGRWAAGNPQPGTWPHGLPADLH